MRSGQVDVYLVGVLTICQAYNSAVQVSITITLQHRKLIFQDDSDFNFQRLLLKIEIPTVL